MIVTAIDDGFLPALVALRNSVSANSPMPIACLTYGSDELADRVESLGIEVRHNVRIDSFLPPGEGTPEGCQPMYARLLAPEMFGDCIWMDADQVVLKSLQPLMEMEFEEPCAAVPALPISRGVVGIDAPQGCGIFSGLIRFNAAEWARQKITEQCLAMMNRPEVCWRFVVQSVLDVVLAGKFRRLPAMWQGFANRPETRPEQYAVLHWHGRELKPWSHEMPNADIWRKFYCMSS